MSLQLWTLLDVAGPPLASPRSFILVPLVGAFFVDLADAVMIQACVSWLGR